MRVLALAIAFVLTATVAASAGPSHRHKAKRWEPPRAERDCTPINGFYGYYGNPWCDTGSYRPPDIEFRERQRFLRRQAQRVRQ